jgi:outer membrane protein OmpA-like peptidoglycan-associated protein
LNFQSSNKLSDGFKDLTLGVTLGFLSNGGSKRFKQNEEARDKIKPTDLEINAFERNPLRMLELSAVDSATGQPVIAKYDVLDEQKERPIVLLRDKYLIRSVFKDMLTVYVTARAKGYFIREVAVEGYDTLKVFQEIKLRKIPQSPIGVFYFDQSSSKMREDYTSKIDSVVSVLQRNQHMNIAIVGHTSADGSSRLNRTLSLKRAKVIRRMLVKSGVDDARTTVTGVGSARQKVTGDTEEYQSVNRRVEVFLRD